MVKGQISPEKPQAWHEGISRYQWLVLTIASAGWVFDVFEGQIFVASMRNAMPALLGVGADHPSVRSWNDWAFGSFLLGGAFGGVLFGIISDKIGRSRTMIITILFYSLFTCVTAFAQHPWQMVVLRFFVAMGVGGEWAVASAMVAEVMPNRSRPVMSSIFHASSVFGTLLAAAVGAYVVGNSALGASAWRWGFAVGVLPALLTLAVRWKLADPEQAVKARQRARQGSGQQTGRLIELFQGVHLRNTLVGVGLASVGLVTFWGAHIYGKNALLRKAETQALLEEQVPLKAPQDEDSDAERDDPLRTAEIQAEIQALEDAFNEPLRTAEIQAEILTAIKALEDAENNPQPKIKSQALKDAYKVKRKAALDKHSGRIKSAEMLSMVLNTIGGGLGLVLFGTISTWLGRKGAFIFYHVLAFGMVLLLFQLLLANDASTILLAITLPVFGFFTLGMHAGYAVYFPELYPTRLRSTGAGFCFNMGRLATAAAFFAFASATVPVSPEKKAILLAPLYLLGVVIVLFARETRDQALPE